MKKPFQGVLNIIRFNWHFYVVSTSFLILLILLSQIGSNSFQLFVNIICSAILIVILVSLLVSFFVYDLSGLYDFKWMEALDVNEPYTIVNINAGFDETSELLKNRFVNSKLVVLDFYDPLKHTEVSIERARKAYPSYPNTKQVKTNDLPFMDKSVDKVFAILSAHEIRNEEERNLFFKELNRITKPNGQIIVTEHLRDFANFLAYNIGFFHFHSKSTWLNTFSSSDLIVSREIQFTSFITTFILEKNGITS